MPAKKEVPRAGCHVYRRILQVASAPQERRRYILFFTVMTRNTVVSGIDKLKPSMTSNDLVQKLSRVAQPEGVFCLILNVFGHACSASRTHTKGKHPVETALLAAEVRRPEQLSH